VFDLRNLVDVLQRHLSHALSRIDSTSYLALSFFNTRSRKGDVMLPVFATRNEMIDPVAQ
jgi:hypothetical protein